MAPEKKAKPRLNLFLYNLPNPACQNPDPEGHLRIQKTQQIDEWDKKRIEKTKNIILRIETFRGITFQIEINASDLHQTKSVSDSWQGNHPRLKNPVATVQNQSLNNLNKHIHNPFIPNKQRTQQVLQKNIRNHKQAGPLKTLEGTPTQANV